MMKKWRTIRVFISSTFRDMHAERDYLVKVAFPELRERLEAHRFHLDDIDLSWEVTSRQAKDRCALEVCLDEIDACRPTEDDKMQRSFFVGLLGQRYGSVLGSIPEATLSRFPWLTSSTKIGGQRLSMQSITALEIIHAVMLRPPLRGQSFFYFRSEQYLTEASGPADRSSARGSSQRRA
jgi:hypothetical protein